MLVSEFVELMYRQWDGTCAYYLVFFTDKLSAKRYKEEAAGLGFALLCSLTDNLDQDQLLQQHATAKKGAGRPPHTKFKTSDGTGCELFLCLPGCNVLPQLVLDKWPVTLAVFIITVSPSPFFGITTTCFAQHWELKLHVQFAKRLFLKNDQWMNTSLHMLWSIVVYSVFFLE